jgi:hypothetical protein
MKKYSLLLIITLLSSTCGDYEEMEKTIFVPDENDKNLPAYTEWGYNSFGAKYERMYFNATNTIVPCKIMYQSGVMTFTLSGRIVSGYSSYNNSGENMTLYISFPIEGTMNNYKDLMALHQKNIDFTDQACQIRMLRGSGTEDITLLSGNLFFKRVQQLRINEEENRAILSGTFEMVFLRNDLPEIISNGRFDVGIAHLFVLP